jgi:hypothetical protein
LTVVVYPNNKVVQVKCPNKSGISTVTDILCYPFFNEFRARGGRKELIRKGVYFTEKPKNTTDFQPDVKIAVIRDPVSRMASCYADRVLRKNRDFSRDAIPSWDYFISNLEKIMEEFPDIRHHAAKQTNWLGTDTNYYDYIFNTHQLSKEFTNVISNISETKIPNTSHRKSSRGLSKSFEITNHHKKLIKDLFPEEYTYWKNYFQ